MQLDHGLDRERADQALRQFDRTHAAYLQQFYGVDVGDPSLYHLALDSTAIGLEACVELIARAARALRLAPTARSANGAPR